MSDDARATLQRLVERAFPAGPNPPEVSLRGGNALDGYESPPPFDPQIDVPSGDYIESYHWGIHFLDPDSWLHYLPILLRYALDQMNGVASAAVDTFLFSLRLPDREPPRFARLSPEQTAALVAVLEALAFTPGSQFQDDALAALDEHWYARSESTHSG